MVVVGGGTWRRRIVISGPHKFAPVARLLTKDGYNLTCGSVRTVSSIWVIWFSVSLISTKLC